MKKTISGVFRTPEVTIEVDDSISFKDVKHLLFAELIKEASEQSNDSELCALERMCSMHLNYVSGEYHE